MRCILGCLDTDTGLKICDEMLEWLKPCHDVKVIHQEPPGVKFEYPAIAEAIDLAITTNEPVLYLHTKGAANLIPGNYKVSMMADCVNYPATAVPEDCQKIVRNMWRQEFTTDRLKLYIERVIKNDCVVVCPFTGPEKYTWQNGFIISQSAAVELKKTFHLDSRRHYYETMMRNTQIKVVGMIFGNITDTLQSRTQMWNEMWRRYNTLPDLTILSATFNKHEFTINMLKSIASILRFLPKTCILDNSCENKFPVFKNTVIEVLDNTNFKNTRDYHCPSKNHCSSIDFALSTIKTRYVLLCDNDIIFKSSIVDLLKSYHDYDVIGEVGYDVVPPDRIFPYMCIIDLDFVRRNGIRYFYEGRCLANGKMDTGCSFYQDLQKKSARIKRINLKDYIVHLKGGTLHNKTLESLIEHERT